MPRLARALGSVPSVLTFDSEQSESRVPRVFVDPIEPDNVGMVHVACQIDLIFQGFHFLNPGLQHGLHGPHGPSGSVGGSSHHAESPIA